MYEVVPYVQFIRVCVRLLAIEPYRSVPTTADAYDFDNVVHTKTGFF